jgi:hypothetical protein
VPLDQGPFVALELDFAASYFSFFTLGGLKTSADGEVLDRAGARSPACLRPAAAHLVCQPGGTAIPRA